MVGSGRKIQILRGKVNIFQQFLTPVLLRHWWDHLGRRPILAASAHARQAVRKCDSHHARQINLIQHQNGHFSRFGVMNRLNGLRHHPSSAADQNDNIGRPRARIAVGLVAGRIQK